MFALIEAIEEGNSFHRCTFVQMKKGKLSLQVSSYNKWFRLKLKFNFEAAHIEQLSPFIQFRESKFNLQDHLKSQIFKKKFNEFHQTNVRYFKETCAVDGNRSLLVHSGSVDERISSENVQRVKCGRQLHIEQE